MGYMGLTAYIVAQISIIRGGPAYEGIPKKIADGFQFLTWAPFLIPFYRRQFGDTYCRSHGTSLHVLIFAVLIACVGLALNVRTVLFMGGATVGLLYFFYALRDKSDISWRTGWKLGTLFLILITVARPISDLATAMQIARTHRGKVTALEMIQSTMDVMGRPYLISQYREEARTQSEYSVYDESYIANPILNRFVETKFHDNALYFASTLSSDESRESLKRVTIDRLWALLPDPLLRVLGIQVDKLSLIFSSGDYLAFLSRGIPMGSYLTGSLFAHGIALFGQPFLLIYAAICFLAFGIMDILTVGPVNGIAYISTVGMLNCWSFFLRGITAEGLESIVGHYAREVPQMIVIYCIVFAFCKLFLQSIPGQSGPLALDVRR